MGDPNTAPAPQSLLLLPQQQDAAETVALLYQSFLAGDFQKADELCTEDAIIVVPNLTQPNDVGRFTTINGKAENDNFRTSWTQLWTPREVTVDYILVDVTSPGGAGSWVVTLTDLSLTFNGTGNTAQHRHQAQLFLVNTDNKISSYEEFSDTSQLARLAKSVPFADPPQDWLLGPTGAMPTIEEATQAADVMYGLYAEAKAAEMVQYMADGVVFNNIPSMTDPAHITSPKNMTGAQEWLEFINDFTSRFFEMSDVVVERRVVDGSGAGGNTGVLAFHALKMTMRNKITGAVLEGRREGGLLRLIKVGGAVKLASFTLYSDTLELARLAEGAA